MMAPNRFFHLASGFVIPVMPKCGLSSTQSTIVKSINGKNFSDIKFDLRTIGRHTFKHDNKPALVPIRDPFERFRSAVWQVNRGSQVIAINEILDGLEAGTYFNQHFQSQSDILKGCDGCESVKLYRFPEDFQQMLTDGGLDPLSQHRNKSTDKPELTEEQETRVRALYADDIALRLKLDT
jgi:hypothetical protein